MMVVLHTTRYGDTSLVVHGYTEEAGRCSFLLRGAYRPSSGKRRQQSHSTVLLHPLSIVNYVASSGTRSSMPYLREFSPKYRLNSIREDFSKIPVAMFVSELLYRTILHSERDAQLYAFIEDSVLKLEAMEGSPANFHIWFMDRYSAFMGFPFEKDSLLDYNPFTPQQVSRLEFMHRASFGEAMACPMTGVERKDIVEAVLRYLEYHTGSRIAMRSMQVFHDVFSDRK